MPVPFQSFSPALIALSPRVTRTGAPSSSIQGINTTTLADGALCYCEENKAEYQLDKTSTAVPDGNLIIAPDSGPGRWNRILVGGTASVAPFTASFYVDSGTAVPVPDQDGSVANPYSTIQAAIDAHPGLSIGLQLVANIYSENVVVPAGTPVSFVCASVAAITSLSLDAGASVFANEGVLSLGALTLGVGARMVGISSFFVSGATTVGDTGEITSELAMSFGGLVTLGDNCVIRLINTAEVISGFVAAVSTNTGSIAITTPDNVYAVTGFTSTPLGGVSAPHYDLKITGLITQGDITCRTLACIGCLLDSTGGPVVVITSETVYLENSKATSNTSFVTTDVVELVDSNVQSTTWNNAVGKAFQLDDFSNYWIKVNGTVLSNAGEKVITSDLVP